MPDEITSPTEKTTHPTERMTKENRIRYFLLAETLDGQSHCNRASAAIQRFYTEYSAARKSAYDGMKNIKGMKEAQLFLEEKFDRNDQMMKEMKRHERDNNREKRQLEQVSRTLHRQLGADGRDLPPAWDNDLQPELESELTQKLYATLTDPKWYKYHDQAMVLKEKMVKALTANQAVSAGLGASG